jgi:hypothetical protein
LSQSRFFKSLSDYRVFSEQVKQAGVVTTEALILFKPPFPRRMPMPCHAMPSGHIVGEESQAKGDEKVKVHW